jgi:membrane-bound serine protease (ClpP class)
LFGLWLGAAALIVAPWPSRAAPKAPVVEVIRIEGMVDLGLASFVHRVVTEAAKANKSAVVLEINTHGGRVDAAVLIRDALLEAKQLRTVAFVNKRAISAGALIALACDSIVMVDGSTIGAATPVTFGESDKPASEKTVSYLRKEFRATAEARGHPALLAEAMVDADVEVPDVIAKGKLLTLTDREALTHGVAKARAKTFAEAMTAAGLPGAIRHDAAETWAESLVRFLTHPLISSLLMAAAMLGILIEIRTPGFGVPGLVGLIALALFFWGHWIVQLAGWEELLLIGTGIVLIIAEIFVIPGFGIAGVLGIAALAAGLGLSLIGGGATAAAIVTALGQVAIALVIAVAGALAALRFLTLLPHGHRLVLATEMSTSGGYGSAPESDTSWRGKHGTAASPLRPAGIADIEGQRVDVVSDGEFVERGAPIVVVRVDGNRIVVHHAPDVPPTRPGMMKEESNDV